MDGRAGWMDVMYLGWGGERNKDDWKSMMIHPY